MSGADLIPGKDFENIIYMTLCMDEGTSHSLQVRGCRTLAAGSAPLMHVVYVCYSSTALLANAFAFWRKTLHALAQNTVYAGWVQHCRTGYSVMDAEAE